MDKKTRKLLGLIPGFDPFLGAEDYFFDPDLALKAVRFIETCCTLTAGEKAGQPFLLEPWQKAIVLNIFGWYRKSDKLRRFREVFIFVPRKNGKTELAAALALTVMFLDNEPKAEIYSAASDAPQAALVFNAAKTMIQQNKDFAGHAKIYVRSITRISGGLEVATYKAISAEAGTKHGYRGHCILIDELHAHRNSDLMDVLITSTGSRREPLIIIITTSDYERENSPCNQKHKYACDVRDGNVQDLKFLPVIYEAKLEDDWTKEATWKKANPNYQVSLYKDYLETECAKAQQNPSYENVFKRLHLNIRTTSEERLFRMQQWDACGFNQPPLHHYEGESCWAALDLGNTSDLTSLCMVFRRGDENDIWDYYWWHWTPRHEIVERGKKHGIDYMAMSSEGWLTLTAGDEMDYALVRRSVSDLADKFGITELGVDRNFQGVQLSQQLQADGLAVVTYPQSFYGMNSPTQEFLRRVNNETICHGGNPLMRWQIGNTQAEIDAEGRMRPSKGKSGNKIDGVVSAIMATGLIAKSYATRGSVYDDMEEIEL